MIPKRTALVAFCLLIAALSSLPATASAQQTPEWVEFEVDAPTEFLPWRQAEITLTLTNTGDAPIAIDRFDGGWDLPEPFRPQADTTGFKCDLSGDEAEISATRMVHDIGARAEMPKPSYWVVDPERGGQARERMIILPGESMRFRCSGRFTYEHHGSTWVSITLVRLRSLNGVYCMTALDEENVPDSGIRGSGDFVPAAKYTARYTKATKDSEQPTACEFADGLRLPAWLADDEAWQALMAGGEYHRVGEMIRVSVLRFHPDIQDMRGILGVAESEPFTRALDAGAWVFADGEYTWVEHRFGIAFAVPGNLLPLVENLNRSGQATLRVSPLREPGAPRPDTPLIRELGDAGFELHDEQEKSGELFTVVDLPAERFQDFAVVIADAHAGFEDGELTVVESGAPDAATAIKRWAECMAAGDVEGMYQLTVRPSEFAHFNVLLYQKLRFDVFDAGEVESSGRRASGSMGMRVKDGVVESLTSALRAVLLHQGVTRGFRGEALLEFQKNAEREVLGRAIEQLTGMTRMWVEVIEQDGRWYVESMSDSSPTIREGKANVGLINSALKVMMAEESGCLLEEIPARCTLAEIADVLDLDAGEFANGPYTAESYRVIVLDHGNYEERRRARYYIEVDLPDGTTYRINEEGEIITDEELEGSGDDSDDSDDSDE